MCSKWFFHNVSKKWKKTGKINAFLTQVLKDINRKIEAKIMPFPTKM